MRRLFTFLLIVVVIAGGVLYFVYQQQAQTARAATTRPTTTITRGSLVATVSGAGNLYAPQQTNLNFQLTGVPITKVSVQVGDKVKAGDVLAQVDDSDLQFSLRTATAGLASAKAKLDALQLPPKQTDVAAAQAALAAAQANYDSAVAKNASTPDQLKSLKITLDKATTALQKAQSDYNAVAWRNDVGMTSQAVTLQNATSDYQKALADYNVAVASITDATVKSAAQSVAQAQANLATLMAPPTAQDITQAQAAVDTAQTTYDQAKRRLDQAKIIAPFDGTVAAVNYVVGQLAVSGGSQPVITLVNLDNLQTQITVSEVDITRIKMGQDVTLIFDALNRQSFPGKITAISPVGTVTQGVVNYGVTVALTRPDPAIRPGMTSEAAIVVDRRDNVLIVPNRAIRTQGTQKVISILSQGEAIPVVVQTGLSNDTNTEVLAAATAQGPIQLREGDAVLLNTATGTATGNRAPGVPGGGGGAFFLGR